MKTLYKLLIVGVAVVFGLTGCLAAFAPFLGGTADADGDQTTETALIDATNTAEATSDPDGTPFNFGGETSGLTYAADQQIDLSFNNGVVDVASGVIPGLTIYELLAAAATTGEYARGAAVAYTAIVIDNGDGSSNAILSMDLDTAAMSDQIEIALDPALVTANGGLKVLNQDLDDTPGEAEDAAFDYAAVGGLPPVTAAGDPRDPLAGVNMTVPGAPTATDTTFVVTGINTAGLYPDRFTATSLAGFTVWSFEPSTLAWTQVAATATYDGAGSLTLTLPAAVVANDIYQIRRDLYNIASSAAAYGFIQRDFYRQNDIANRYARTNLLVETGSSVATLDTGARTNDVSSDPPASIQVGFNGVGDIIASTITQDSVRFIIDENGGSDPPPAQIPWTYFILTDGTDGANDFTFYFGSTFDPDGNDDWEVLVYPTVTDDNGTPADATDDIPVLNTGDAFAGVSTDNASFNF